MTQTMTQTPHAPELVLARSWSMLGTCSLQLNFCHGLPCGGLRATHSLAIGRDLGVSRQAVQQWLSGATQPSRMALILAEQLYRAPLEMAAGLPLAAERAPTDLVVYVRARA